MTPLRTERERRGLTASAVAAAVGATQSHYSKVEKSLAQASPDLANRLAKYFGNAVTRDQILYPEDYVDTIPSKAAHSTPKLAEAS